MELASAIETAYCFFHQKWNIYRYSSMEWQKDDIEIAISSYIDEMSPELYAMLSGGNPDFLHQHSMFGEQLEQAVGRLENYVIAHLH